MLAIGAAVLVVGGAVVSRSMAIHRVPVAEPIVVATQAPAVGLAPPQGVAEPAMAETTGPASDRTETAKPDVPAGVGSASLPVSVPPPRATDRGVTQGPPQGKKSNHAAEPHASGGPAMSAKSSGAARTQRATGGKPSLEDLIRQSVHDGASK
jgi:hypothetical protein